MNPKELEKELRIKYSTHRKTLSDPFELLDLVIDISTLSGAEKEKAVELAEEIYFHYDAERNEYLEDR